MDVRLDGKVALVTGASRGIGKGIAKAFAESGAKVMLTSRKLDGLEAAAAEIDGDVAVHAAHVGKPEDAVACVDATIERFGGVDILVNNAGANPYYGPTMEVDEARYDKTFEVNLRGPVFWSQQVWLKAFKDKPGVIINISSVGGRIYEPFGGWYHATKFAVEGLSDSLRMELKPFGIHVVIVQPAAIVTEWNTIARDSLLERSGDTAYGRYARRAHQVLTDFDRPDSRTVNRPEVVGRKIAKAATTKRPAARYPVGKGARAATTGRDLLPDAVFDQIISRTFGSR